MLLHFQPFYFSEKILGWYFKYFSNKRFEGVLYEGTPKTREEVRAWILGCIEDKSKRYFFMFRSDNLIGHIGLRGINIKRKHAELGSFFPNKRNWEGEAMESALEFVIKQADKLSLKLLSADFEDENDPRIKIYKKAGFTPTPLAPHYLTLKL